MSKQSNQQKKTLKSEDLPPIPDKLYFGIREVSQLCAVKPHVLRYWEQEFSQLRPLKGQGNRRHYQHKDVHLVRRIRTLLYEEGFTINGARQRLSAKDKQINEPAVSEVTRIPQSLDTQKLVDELSQVVTLLER